MGSNNIIHNTRRRRIWFGDWHIGGSHDLAGRLDTAGRFILLSSLSPPRVVVIIFCHYGRCYNVISSFAAYRYNRVSQTLLNMYPKYEKKIKKIMCFNAHTATPVRPFDYIMSVCPSVRPSSVCHIQPFYFFVKTSWSLFISQQQQQRRQQ